MSRVSFSLGVVRAPCDYRGGTIMAGPRIAMEALEKKTARIPTVEIVSRAELVSRATVESIQSGRYFGNRAAVKGLTQESREQLFWERVGPTRERLSF